MKEWGMEAAVAEVAARTQPAATATPDTASAQHLFAVIFSSKRSQDIEGYGAMTDRMVELASAQPGFVGIESARGADGFGITVSYWSSLEAIARWKANAKHRAAQEQGKSRFYERYSVRICSVERSYGKTR